MLPAVGGLVNARIITALLDRRALLQLVEPIEDNTQRYGGRHVSRTRRQDADESAVRQRIERSFRSRASVSRRSRNHHRLPERQTRSARDRDAGHLTGSCAAAAHIE